MRLLFMALMAIAPAAAAQEAPAGSAPGAEPAPVEGNPDEAPDGTEPETAPDGPAEPDRRPLVITDEQRFEQGATLFELGDCESVITVLADFTLGGVNRSNEQLVDAHRMLGVCYFQQGKRPEAERELKQLLYINPDYELDPFLTPPPVVSLYDELKVELADKLEEIRVARTKVDDVNTQPPKTVQVTVQIEREVRTTPWITTLIPFGGAKYANDEPVKAVAFFAAQASAVGLAGLVFGLLQVFHPEGTIFGQLPPYIFRFDNTTDPPTVLPPEFDVGEPILPVGDQNVQQQIATVLWLTQGVTFLLIAGVYAAGVSEAIYSREAEVVVNESRTESEPEELPVAQPTALLAGSVHMDAE